MARRAARARAKKQNYACDGTLCVHSNVLNVTQKHALWHRRAAPVNHSSKCAHRSRATRVQVNPCQFDPTHRLNTCSARPGVIGSARSRRAPQFSADACTNTQKKINLCTILSIPIYPNMLLNTRKRISAPPHRAPAATARKKKLHLRRRAIQASPSCRHLCARRLLCCWSSGMLDSAHSRRAPSFRAAHATKKKISKVHGWFVPRHWILISFT